MKEEDLDPPVNFDLDRIKASLESGTISLPRGQTASERREWLRAKLKEIDAQANTDKDSQ